MIDRIASVWNFWFILRFILNSAIWYGSWKISGEWMAESRVMNKIQQLKVRLIYYSSSVYCAMIMLKTNGEITSMVKRNTKQWSCLKYRNDF